MIIQLLEFLRRQLDVQLFVNVCRVDYLWCYFLFRQFIVASQAKLDHFDELTLLFEWQVLVQENLRLGERNADELLSFGWIKEVVRDALKLQVITDTWLNHVVDRSGLWEDNFWSKVDVELSGEALKVLLNFCWVCWALQSALHQIWLELDFTYFIELFENWEWVEVDGRLLLVTRFGDLVVDCWVNWVDCIGDGEDLIDLLYLK